jgi:DNA-binding transcriptional regulator GbsR (MarR family)
MNSQNTSPNKQSKKPKKTLSSDLEDTITILFQKGLQDELTKFYLELKDVKSDLRTSLRDMSEEIQEIKALARKNRQSLDSIMDSPLIEEKELEGIATGLDMIQNVPSHLRRTFQVLFYKKKGATASEVAHETKKSRPLESDYLNQLFEKGVVIKKHDPTNRKKIRFYVKSSPIIIEENGEPDNITDSDLISDKKALVAKNSINNHT